MKDVINYLDEIKSKIAASPALTFAEIVTERTLVDRGYFRVRLTLINGDFLELSEYFVVESGTILTLEYRYQWMNFPQQKLIKRWDNAKHFPGLPNFPHHVHVGDEKQVVSGEPISIIELIDLIEQEIIRT
jgi:hypothetical protein